MRKRTEYSIYLVLSALLVFIQLFIAHYSNRRINEEIAYHGKALSSYAWELDYQGVKQYMSLAVNSYAYGRARFYDMSTNRIQGDVSGKEPNRIDSFLMELGVLRSTEKEVELFHGNELIGILTIESYNRYIYWQFYLFLVYILVFFITSLIMNLARARQLLEERVKLRTADLEEEVNSRLKAEENLRMTLDSIGEGVISTDRDGIITGINPVARQMINISFKEGIGSLLEDVLDIRNDEMGSTRENPFRDILERGSLNHVKGHPRTLVSRTGEKYQIVESGTPIRSQKGELMGIVLVIRDMTGEFKLQKQLEHSQRMDAVGQLAGGIAHDFNNMLGGILGSSELLESYIGDNDMAVQMNRLIHETTERAAELTRQLLAFSRKGGIEHTPVDLHEVIAATASLLERTIDRRVEIHMDLKAEHSEIFGDSSMIQNVIINLGINASHAIEGSGNLSLSTRNTEFDEDYCRSSPFEIEPGAYLELAVEDDGSGMSEEVKNHIFEPFFTTKAQGKGTGLGLAMVYGTVKQHQGEIRVYSEVGRGTSFILSFPLLEINRQSKTADEVNPPPGTETILVVDDIDIMRLTARGYLEEAGYTVITAEDGYEAIDIFSRDPSGIDLVIVDMIMPRMSGKECFFELRKISPRIPVILSSGFVNNDDFRIMKLQGLSGSISKPYRGRELVKLVYSVLHRENVPPA